MRVNICGIPHKVIEKEDAFTADNTHLGEITYSKAEILINKDLPQAIKEETICHEVVHGIFVHLGHEDLAQNEQLVQQLGNAIYNGFTIKDLDKGKNRREEPTMYECFHCGKKAVIWGSDFTFEDYGMDGEGIIHTCTCTNCGEEIEYFVAENNEEDPDAEPKEKCSQKSQKNLEDIKADICDQICRWPYLWDEEQDGPLCESPQCRDCPTKKIDTN